MTDEGVTTTFYADVDGDIYGVTAMAMMACAMPTGLGGATANASTSSVVLLPNASGFIAVYTTAGGIFARTFGAATGSGTPVLVTATVPTAFDAATNGDDLIVAWSEYDPSASRLSARRFVASTLVPYAGAMLLNTSTKFTVFAEIAMAMTSTQVLIAASQPSAIGFTRCTNTLASVVSGTIRSTADDDRPKLDLVVDRATSERLLAFENGGALTVQFVSSAGATVGIASPLGAAGGSEVAVAPSANSSAPGILGAAWIEGTTARFETLSGSGFGASRTPVIRSCPTNIRTGVRVVGGTAPLLDPIGLASSGGRWHVSSFDGTSAAAARAELGTSVTGDGTAAPAFTFYSSPDPTGTSRRATAVMGTAGNRVLLASETTVWRVGCP